MRAKRKLVVAVAVIAVVIAGILIIKAVSGRAIASSGDSGLTSDASVTGLKDYDSNSIEDTAAAADTAGPAESAGDNFAEDMPASAPESSVESAGLGKFKVKAVYLTGISAGSKTLDHYIDVINKTELNAVVIDVKEAGRVNYPSSVPEVADNKLYVKYYDPEKVIKKLHDNNIYVIGRVVCFKDDGLAAKRPDLAVKRTDGSVWKEDKKNNTGAWTNPYKEEVWQYNIDIAKEALEKGFDEIQFDYVRFPTAKKSEVDYGDDAATLKPDAISGFLKLASEELRKGMGKPVSADVFGIIAESKSDGDAIGQDLEKVGMNIDCISPMVYPSHYANGQEVNGVAFPKPDLDPYGVVYQTLVKAKDRISKVPGYTADIRPYLQDFTATWLHKGDYQEYGAEQVRQQIQAVYDAGFDQWILWDASNTYTDEAMEPEP